tara:strand:- start:7491 stop:9173 length:1683 start_codon:yes stop_codon:yes gene_type:complete
MGGSGRKLEDIPDDDWQLAVDRQATIRRLADLDIITKDDVRAASEELGLGRSRIFELVANYRKHGGGASSIASKRRGPKEGASRLSEELDEFIYASIDRFYGRRQKPKIADLCLEIATDCNERGWKAPSRAAVEARIARLDQWRLLAQREGEKIAGDKYRPVGVKFTMSRALQWVQGDHTVADVMLVDDVFRRSICRPLVTFFIDVFTRIVLGWYVSFEEPSRTSLGMALHHAVFPKDRYLRNFGLDLDLPGHGVPETISLDNAKAHLSPDFLRGCQQHGIERHLRPVKKPWFGGHIERFIGTMMGAVHLIPGSTYSSIAERKEYDSESEACMTIGEFERWLAIQISIYHNQKHSALGVTPLTAWAEAMHDRPVLRWLPDEHDFVLHFLPSERRMVRPDGIRLFNVFYKNDGAQAFVDGSTKKEKVKYNPRDMSTIYLENKAGEHLSVGYKDLTRPPVTKHELDIANEALLERGRNSVNEERLFEMIRLRRDHIAQSVTKTKTARREAMRITHAIAEGRAIADKARHAPKLLPAPADLGSANCKVPNDEVVMPFEIEFED